MTILPATERIQQQQPDAVLQMTKMQSSSTCAFLPGLPGKCLL